MQNGLGRVTISGEIQARKAASEYGALKNHARWRAGLLSFVIPKRVDTPPMATTFISVAI